MVDKSDKAVDLLSGGARVRVLGHHVVQRLHADVDDATELVLDHTETKDRKKVVCNKTKLYWSASFT
jgi:hypothetical protein